jgi:NAD(P)-dependent dehydrogenase (short-subunit alcohol dehydrogenase family)
MRQLQGQVGLVTGGGGGLGEAICLCLAAAGAVVVAGDVRLERAVAVAEGLSRAGLAAEPMYLDVADADQSGLAVQELVHRHGRLDILVNGAGIDVTLPAEELTVADWDRVLDVNLRGSFVLSRLALPIMRDQGRGHVVNVVSTAGKRVWANASAYHASKWGLLGLSHALHVEARPHGVKVTAVIAGGMRTPFILDRFPEVDPAVLQDPRNVAETILFVLSQPPETVVPEVMVLPMRETSWP